MSSLSRDALQSLQSRLNYQFRDQALLLKSLTHRSAGNNNNERLEFLGDALVNLVVAKAFFTHFSDSDEGKLTRLRANVVSGESLANVAQRLMLSDFLILGESERRSGGRKRRSILADTLEALAGAVLLDAGISRAMQVVEGWLKETIDGTSPEFTVDAKTRLQEWLQARREALPNYNIIEVLGSDHDQTFRVRCHVPSHDAEAEGHGSSRRRAEQEAAAKVLDRILNRE